MKQPNNLLRLYSCGKLVCLCLTTMLLLQLAACGGPRVGRVSGDGSVQYDDPTAVETVTIDYGSTDLQSTAEFMTQSLLNAPVIMDAKNKPSIRLRTVVNYTDEHIDTKGITDKIRVKLLSSGKVRFLADMSNLDQVYDERELNSGDPIDPDSEGTKKKTTPASEKLAKSDYIVTGAVRSIRKRSKKVDDVYYQITMELVSPRTGEIFWASEKEIRKNQEKSTFGW